MNPQILEMIDELEKNGQGAQIVPLLVNVIKTAPNDAGAWYTLSKYLPEPERRLECLDRSLRLDPKHEEARLAREAMSGLVTEPVIHNHATDPAEKNTPTEAIVPSITAAAGAEPKKKAGESTAKIAKYYRGWSKIDKILLIASVILMVMSAIIFLLGASHFITFVTGFVVFLFLSKQVVNAVFEKRKDEKKSRSFAKGARGEEIVGTILGSLGADYRVWHDVPCKHGNIDHVVLSKKGQLFMIETKAHGGRVRVKGSTLYVNDGEPEKDMIGQCLCNLYDLRELVQEVTGISAWVTGYLVFTQAFVEPCKPVSNIRILNKKYLKRGIEETAANGQGRYELWSDAGALDEAFSKENKTYAEFGKKDFARVSGWGES